MRRRPSASLVVSFVALFVALGGVGYAATQLPNNSVGTAQLRNGSVGNWKLKSGAVGGRKIINGAVGAKQVNSTQVQLRVGTPCASGAISAIGLSGNVTCTPALPNEYGATTSNTTVGPGPLSTLVISEQLGGFPRNYLVLGDVHWTVSGTPTSHQSVDLQCSLQVGTSSTSGESIANLDTNQTTQAGTIPIALPGTINGTHGLATIACGFTATPATPAPTVIASATLNAIQTAANG